MWRDKLIAYIDLDRPVIDDVEQQHRRLHVTASPSLRQLVDSLADEVLQSVLSCVGLGQSPSPLSYQQHRRLHVTESPSLRQLVDSLADEVLQSVLSCVGLGQSTLPLILSTTSKTSRHWVTVTKTARRQPYPFTSPPSTLSFSIFSFFAFFTRCIPFLAFPSFSILPDSPTPFPGRMSWRRLNLALVFCVLILCILCGTGAYVFFS